MKFKKSYAIITAAVILVGSIFAVNQFSTPKMDVADLPTCVDTDMGGGVTIEDDEVPLGNTKVSTKTSTKKNSKKVTLKKASKKTYSKTKKTAKTATKTTKSSTQTVKTVTKTNTTVLEKYKKKSKIKTVMTTVKTTVKTTTTTATASQAKSTATATSLSTASVSNGEKAIKSMAPKADARLLSAFTKLGFVSKVQSDVSYSGMFDARSQSITMKQQNDVIYHELGHFLGFVTGNVDKLSEFGAIYKAEKDDYNGSNKAYVTQNAAEYFAESYRDYVTRPNTLKSDRPQTYAFIVKTLNAVTEEQVNYIQAVYGAYWTQRNAK